MGIAHRRAGLSVAKQMPDCVQADAMARQHGRIGVPQIMQPHAVEPCRLLDRCPRPFQIDAVRFAIKTGKDVFALPIYPGKQLTGWGAQWDAMLGCRFRCVSRLRPNALLDIDIGPFCRQRLATA